LPELFFSAA